MIDLPPTISRLIQRLESGVEPTPEELRREADLQALYIAKAGEDYVQQMVEENKGQSDKFRQSLES